MHLNYIFRTGRDAHPTRIRLFWIIQFKCFLAYHGALRHFLITNKNKIIFSRNTPYNSKGVFVFPNTKLFPKTELKFARKNVTYCKYIGGFFELRLRVSQGGTFKFIAGATVREQSPIYQSFFSYILALRTWHILKV